jgi:2-polyprenyl-6-methoxyphenol hydroxylase-like FAD-dependent oxidoreductase
LASRVASDPSTEIIIVGAGAAGVTAAAVLGQRGHRVLLLDANPTCPPVFKAEKIEGAQLQLLRQFGLVEQLLPFCSRISEVHAAFDGRIFKTTPYQQLGLTYSTLVDTLRERLPSNVQFQVARVAAIHPSPYTPSVELETGEHLAARLVIFACGSNRALEASLGLTRRVLQKEQSMALGFNIAPQKSRSFPFQAVTYYPTTNADRVDYLTLFKIPRAMRANLFLFRSISDPWVREFLQQPRLLLERCFPKLPRVIGEFSVTGRVEAARIDLYRNEGNPQPGVVLIGDALQNVCPSTGLGLNKVFTDIDVLAECVPVWFTNHVIDAAQLAQFYQHPRKLAADSHALAAADRHRRAVIDASPRWRAHRALLHTKWRWTPVWTVPPIAAQSLKRA